MDPRQRLLDGAAAHVAAHGFADLSLRELAAALGTSHRMLLYHFGSKDELFVEIIRSFERAQRDAVRALVEAAPPDEPVEALLARVWRQVADPALADQVRLFFRVCGQALGSPAAGDDAVEHQRRLAAIVGDWLDPMTDVELRRRPGARRADVRADVRTGIAVMRGLLLDLLATGDRRGVDRAFARYLATWSATGEAVSGRGRG